uniref:Ionotropic glutamate receptor C-terminal domain-containing protein n=1 Tax=Anopheles culicifacies TaxID=139723 RepID=A0A182M0E4_9DIPT
MLIWIFTLMEIYFKLTIHFRTYENDEDIHNALEKGEIDLGMIAEPIGNDTKNRILVAKMDQHLYLPMNHTHHSDTFFIDIFARDLRCALLGFLMLIVLLNVLLTRKHSPIRHLLFIYELLSGTRAYPHPNEHIPNRAMQLLVGIVLQIVSCALATFLVAQLSIPITVLPVRNIDDLVHFPKYKVCIPMLRNVARHIPAIARVHHMQERYDRKCHQAVQMGDPETLAAYLCDRNNHVVVLMSDVIMNSIFHNDTLLKTMCNIVRIERKIIVNWISLPYTAKFKHAEYVKQFLLKMHSVGLLQKPYRHLTGSWNRHNKHKKSRWADIELSSLKMLFLGYGTIGCCSLVMLVVEILVAKASKLYRRFRK